MIQPTITLTLPLTDAEVIRLALAHHALGVRPWAAMEGEDNARAALAQLERTQHAVEDAIRSSGFSIYPSQESR